MKSICLNKKLTVLTLTLLVTLVAKRTNAQNMLNRQETEIKTYEAKVGGLLRTDRGGQIGVEPHAFDILIYLFPERQNHKNDTLVMTFFFRHNQCYKYVITYKNQKELPFFINSFNSSAKLKRSGGDLKWLNTQEKYFIEIQKQVNVHSGEEPHFVMEIYNSSPE
jgi:hypothetical protein